MRILCYGSQGWIGQQMTQLAIEKGHTIINGQVRLENYNDLFTEISKIKPDNIFSSTGRTHGVTPDGRVYSAIDYLEVPGNLDINIRDNLIGPLNLAKISKNFGIHCTYIGTGCIYEYDDIHKQPIESSLDIPIDCNGYIGYSENDILNFKKSSYSTIKGWADIQMRQYENIVLNIRVRMPISCNDSSRDLVTKLTHYAHICSIPNSMTVLPEILPIILHMMENNITGTFNTCNPGVISHNQLLNMYKLYVDPSFDWENFTFDEQTDLLKTGRSNNYLNTSKLESYCNSNNLTLTPIFTCVKNVLQKRGNIS